MDLESMKRKELQALCKEHGIPANTTNSQMIESLSSILLVKGKLKGCLKGSGGSSGEELGFVRGRAKKVTFVHQDEEKDEDEEFVVKAVGKSKRKSIGRRSSVAPEPAKSGGEIKEDSSFESSRNVVEVPRRSTRSRGLAEAVVWSPVIEKKQKKKAADGAEGVRENSKVVSGKEKNKVSGGVPSIRSLRNRVVVAGRDEEVVTGQKPGKTQKRKFSDKGENENTAASMVEDESAGRKNLRKRTRDEDTVEDEPPRRRSTRSHATLEETVAIEDVDVGGANKRKKAVEKEIEDTNLGGNISDAAVVKKAQSRGRPRASKQGDSEGVKFDGEAVAGPTRRSTRSASSVSAVGKSDKKGDAVVKGKSQKQSEDRVLKGGDSASILPVSEAQPEPVRRSTRSSSAVLEDESSLPAAGKSARGGKAVKKGEMKKQANDHGLEGGGSEISFPDAEVVAALTRRSTRNSSSLLENKTSLPVGRHSVEEDEAIRKGKSQKQGGARASKGVPTAGLSVNETITESARRLTRSSSRSSGNEALFPAVGKLASVDEVIPNDTPGKKQGESDPKPEDPTSVHSARRSTRSSSKLSEDTILSPIASVHASKRRDWAVSSPNSEFAITPTRRSTHSSSKLFEGEMPNNVAVRTPMRSKHSLSKSLEYDTLRKVKASDNDNEIKNNKSVRLSNNSESNLGDSTPPVPEEEESVSTSARRSTHSSSKSLGDGISLQVESLGIYNEAVSEDKSGRKPKNHASKQRGSTASVLCSPVVPESLRRSTRSSLNHDSLKVETSLSLTSKLDNDDDSIEKSNPRVESETVKRKKTRKDQIEDDLKGQGSAATGFGFKAAAQTEALGVFEQCEEVSRRLSRSASNLDKSRVSVLFTPSSEIIETKQKKKSMRITASKEDMLVVESETVGGSVSRDALQASSTSSLRKSSMKVSADDDVVQGHCSLAPASGLLEDERNVPEVAQSPVNSQLQKVENDVSLGPKDLDDVCFDSHFKEKQSSFLEMTNEGGDALFSGFINDSSKLLESVSRKVASSNVDLPVEAEGTEESHGYDKDKDLAPAEFVSSTMEVSRSMGTSVGALDDVDNIVGMESQNTTGPAIPLKSSDKPKAFHTKTSAVFQCKEPNAQVEVDIDHEDVLRSKEATQISSPQLPFKSSEELLLTSDAETSAEVDHEMPKLKAEIHDSTGEDLEGNETTDIGETTIVDKSSEGLSPISDAALYAEEPDSKVDVPSEDVMVGGEATKMIDRIITNTENSPRALCDLNIEGPDSEVEDHVMAKGGMVNSEDMNTAGSPFSCKSTGVLSPSLLPTLFNEVCPSINVGEPCLKVDSCDMSKVTSHSNALIGEASDLHSETLEVVGKIKALGEDTDSYSCKASLEVIKETWVSSTSTDTVNDDGGQNDRDNNEDELKPSLPSESPALDLCSGQHLRGDRSMSSPEEVENGSTTLRSHDKEDLRHLTDQQGVGVDTTEHVHVDAVDRSLKSTAKVHDDAKPLDVVADVLAEVADTTKKLTAVNIERSLELGAVVEEEMETIESLESEANIEEAGNNAIENIDGIGQGKSDHFDEGGQEFHAHDIGSHLSVEKSASIAGGENVLSLENFETTYAENAVPVLSKMDVVFSGKPQLEEDNMEKASAEKENPSSEELPSSVSFI
ncbi:uncharacterized protein A4U43_C09F1880 [Asparagus officinalis]|uniref:Uncharacterized protein n=1 Tax=Asparagus officinalis TaxID=4686 RepID=A0A5P1E6F2_ASPOF|nr:uncharacterized protein LOC109824166 [Asparagus officinalis]ONK57573.1 uncharacterized protein A4U43_C09F1880 [Asparagus officinalis]